MTKAEIIEDIESLVQCVKINIIRISQLPIGSDGAFYQNVLSADNQKQIAELTKQLEAMK
jgi:hypothetical protein